MRFSILIVVIGTAVLLAVLIFYGIKAKRHRKTRLSRRELIIAVLLGAVALFSIGIGTTTLALSRIQFVDATPEERTFRILMMVLGLIIVPIFGTSILAIGLVLVGRVSYYTRYGQQINGEMRDLFREALLDTVLPELELSGYEAREDPREKILHPYLAKSLEDGMNAFVVFVQGERRMIQHWERSDSHHSFFFEVRLFRKNRESPLDDIIDYTGESHVDWLDTTLSKLLWHTYGLCDYQSESVQWEYSSREELEEQLRDAVDKIKQYGIPWLEDPESRNPNRQE